MKPSFIFKSVKIDIMRCFIAVDIDDKMVERIVNLQNEISKLDVNVKFIEPENLHFTLKFLGDVNEEDINLVRKSLSESLKNEVEFEISIDSIGYFGSRSYIRTIWLGLNKGKEEFENLMKNVNSCVKLGKKNLSPHLTVGRVKSGKNRDSLLKFIGEANGVNVGSMNVKEVKLKSSELTKNGPIYSDLYTFTLGM